MNKTMKLLMVLFIAFGISACSNKKENTQPVDTDPVDNTPVVDTKPMNDPMSCCSPSDLTGEGNLLELAVDAASDGYPAYYMINCAHPDHFASVLGKEEWCARIGGLVANASRCSHAELDEAEVLDDGNPLELAQQLVKTRDAFPHIRVLGGCCGTDMRHMAKIAEMALQKR